MEKARDAFRTISEVASWLETPAHVLRFWESKFSQVKPVKRAGGRRYYRPGDMQLLGGIKKLLHEDGMTIKGVQKILREEGIKHVSALSPALDMDGDFDAPDEADVAATLKVEKKDQQADKPVSDISDADKPKASQNPPAISPQMAERVLQEARQSDDRAADQAETAGGMNGAAQVDHDAKDSVAEAAKDEAEAAQLEEDTPAPQEPPQNSEPEAADTEAEPSQEPPLSSPPDDAPEAPEPLVADGIGDDPADTALEVPPAIAAQIRSMDKAAMATKRDQIAPLYARLSALRDRMGR